MAKRKALPHSRDSKFDLPMLKDLASDLQTGKTPLDRVTVSDDMVVGLRAMVTKKGNISLHASYHFNDSRPMIRLGDPTVSPKDPDYISLTDAREVTKTIKNLALKGIDPAEGAQRRLIRELREKGEAWRPK
jgi:hypothetical protein